MSSGPATTSAPMTGVQSEVALTAVYTSSSPLDGRKGLLVTDGSRRQLHMFERFVAPGVPPEPLPAGEHLKTGRRGNALDEV